MKAGRLLANRLAETHDDAELVGVDAKAEGKEGGDGGEDDHHPEDERARQVRAPRHRLFEFVLAALQQFLEIGPLIWGAAVATAATALVPRHETCLPSAAAGIA